jgi:hypothetical protein
MSKQVDIITTLKGEDAKRFLRNLEHPPKNKAWEKSLAKARRIKIKF